MKEPKFKLGDRVRVYCNRHLKVFTGVIYDINHIGTAFKNEYGKVYSISNSIMYLIEPDEKCFPRSNYFEKQLRRLVKKKKSYVSYDEVVEMLSRAHEKYLELKQRIDTRVDDIENKFSNDGCELFKLKQKISDDWQNTCMRINKLSIRIEKLENK